ncbi:MAG: type II secretion system F family protein [Gemmatimonadales bacterium]|jgi:tight adherence protein B|nr:MAG: type II secretion system F family protein [Gemmatimonadales bacterium]
MDISIGLTAVLVFSAAVFSTLAVVLTWEVFRDWLTRRQVAKRLEPVMTQLDRDERGTSDDLIRQFQDSDGFFAELARSLPGVERTKALIREADVEWRPETVLLMATGIAFGLGAAAYLVTGTLIFGFVAALVGSSFPYFYLTRRRSNRLNHFEEQFPESIDLLTRAIRAGHPLASGMRMVADEGPEVVAKEFRQTFEEQRFGLPFSDALLGMVDRVNLVDVRIFTIAVLIQREVGGNLAEILDNLAETIRGRFYIRRQLRVYTAQGRLSGYALAVLPVFVGVVTYMMQPDYIGLLFTTTVGKGMVVIALMLQAMGVIWIRNIINIDI